MPKLKNLSLYYAVLEDGPSINQQLLEGLYSHINDSETRKTHQFMGRYENIYIGADKIPAINSILDKVTEIAADILDEPKENLKAGLWFNVMGSGDRTTLHRHDDDDELLSAVYYVKVPENSGNLILEKKPMRTVVTPQESMFVFFPPNMPHEVSENLSDENRVSLGINIGPVHSE